MNAGNFRIGADHPCLPGHFPGNPVVPGVVLLENVMSVIIGRNVPARWNAVKFVRPVKPGDVVDVCAEYQDGKIRFECRVGGQLVSKGVLERIETEM